MSYVVAEFIVGWLFCGMQDCERMADLSHTVFVWSTTKAFKPTDTHTHAYTHTWTHFDEWNRRECQAFHFAWKQPLTYLGDWSPCILTDTPWHRRYWYNPSVLSPPCLQTLRFSRRELLIQSIRIFDLENEGQWCWWFVWKLACEGTLSTCMCVKIGTSSSSHLFAVHNRTFRYGWSNIHSARIHTVLQERCKMLKNFYCLKLRKLRKYLQFVNIPWLCTLSTVSP